jgi:arginyl-tRNA synthetase
MNPYIQSLAEEIASLYIEKGIGDADELLRKVQSELNLKYSEEDKLGLLTIILEANEKEFQRHLKDECTNPKECRDNKQHQRVTYFLQRELQELGVNINADHFTWEEKSQYNAQLDNLIETLTASNQLLSEQLEILRTEIEELKNLYVLGKKNWKQILLGKTGEMVASGIVSEAVSKPLLDLAKNTLQNLIP